MVPSSKEVYAHTHTHTHTHTAQAPAHTSLLTMQSLIYAQVKTGSKQRLEADEDSSTERLSLTRRQYVRNGGVTTLGVVV